MQPDEYTPHGYLNVPNHTRNLNPLGVLRSWGCGFRWHFPAYAGMYGGRRETYRAGLQVVPAPETPVTCPYHSGNLFVFRWGETSVRYHLVGDHVLRAMIHSSEPITLRCGYERLLAANGEWGESGLVGRAVDGCLVLQGFEDGDAFVLWASAPLDSVSVGGSPAPAHHGAFTTVIGRRGGVVVLEATCQIAAGAPVEVLWARGKTHDAAMRVLRDAQTNGATAEATARADDKRFWALTPRLSGDWPDHWRRGMVYDMDTVRMMVKQPCGVYEHIWDAMQLHAPRVVLAETAMDALLLGYADVPLAQQLLLGTLADASAANVPCSREDGSYNMVAADGTVCGTAPSWGYPFLVAAWLWHARPDRGWLLTIYPLLAKHLRWWLAERSDDDGWLHFACSWESGQDESPRFGPQSLGGGHPIRHVRPVDLHGAVAHAAGTLARWAALLGYADDAATWQTLADDYTARLGALWNGERFADYDASAATLTATDDVMLLAPLALGVTMPAQIAALGPALQRLRAEAQEWPMGAWTATESLLAAGMTQHAAEIAAAVCDRAYGFWDAREAMPDRTLPGVACEYWPTNGRCGGEGYGWGAFTTHLLLRVLLGIMPENGALQVRPNLPPRWRKVGTRYGVHLPQFLAEPLLIEPLGADRVAVTVGTTRHELAWGEGVVVATNNGDENTSPPC